MAEPATETPNPTPPSSIVVRPDLIDEQYSAEQYEQMLALYEGTMSSIVVPRSRPR